MAGRPPKADRDTWIRGGFEVLLARGASAVTVDGVARELGVTKGSFYWHFGTRDELLAAVLRRWAAERTEDLIRAADDDPLTALAALFVRVGETPVGEAALYVPAAEQHPLVREALAAVTAARLAHVTDLLRRLGHPPRDAADRARLALAIAIGSQTLEQTVPGQREDAAGRRRRHRLALALVHPGR